MQIDLERTGPRRLSPTELNFMASVLSASIIPSEEDLLLDGFGPFSPEGKFVLVDRLTGRENLAWSHALVGFNPAGHLVSIVRQNQFEFLKRLGSPKETNFNPFAVTLKVYDQGCEVVLETIFADWVRLIKPQLSGLHRVTRSGYLLDARGVNLGNKRVRGVDLEQLLKAVDEGAVPTGFSEKPFIRIDPQLIVPKNQFTIEDEAQGRIPLGTAVEVIFSDLLPGLKQDDVALLPHPDLSRIKLLEREIRYPLSARLRAA